MQVTGMVTCMVTWKLKEPVSVQCYKIIFDLRIKAMNQPHYISSKSLQDYDDPTKITVLSKWACIEGLNEWFKSPERESIVKQMKSCLKNPTKYKIYRALKLKKKLEGEFTA